MEQRGGVKSFVARPLGRILLTAIATATLIGSFLYLGPLLAIPTLLFFGLAIPIYLGWKRPRQLALVGLAALLIAAPIGSLWEANLIRQPSPAANSDAVFPYGNGGAVLEGAKVTPFAGDSGSTFNFTVTLHPEFVPKNTSGLLWIEVFVTTCPGATGNTSPNCPSGYPFYTANRTLGPNLTGPVVEAFQQSLPGANLWWFQFATAYKTNGSTNYTWIFLDPGNGYGAVQGPVSGDYYSTVGLIIPNFYVVMFLYPGSVFFIGLLIYYIFKRREAARKARAGPEPEAATPVAPTAATTPSRPAGDEKRCPKCNAVVYPNEANCWKCGQSLAAATGADAPLSGSTKGP